jgi:hypothetical protein
MSVVKFLIQNIDDVNTEDFVGRLRTKISECFTTMDEIDDDMPESFMEFMDGFNALQLSAFCNRIPVDVMRTLLEAGVDVEKTTRAGKTSLMLSTSGRNPPVAREKMKLLLEYSANIDAYDGSFETALHIACYEGNLDGMKMILEERKKRIEYENGRQARQEAAERLKGYIDSDTIGINHWPRGEENGLMRPLYLDPLHLKNSENETPLTIAMGSCLKPFSTKIKVRNERRKEMMKLLIDSGADPDSTRYKSPRPPHWEEEDIRVEGVHWERLDKGWRPYELDAPLTSKAPFLCYGLISNLICQDGTIKINIMIRKEFYDVNVCFDSELLHEIIDFEESYFNLGTEIDIEKLFTSCSGTRFDFYESKEYVNDESDDEDENSGDDMPKIDKKMVDMPKIDGCDCDILFEVTDSGKMTKILLGSDTSPRNKKNLVKIAIRFPRGPFPNDLDEVSIYSLRRETTIRDDLTCLQHAAKCPINSQRKIMLRAAIPLCNPLIENRFGCTAVQLLEKTLAEAERSLLPNPPTSIFHTQMGSIIRSARVTSKTDRHLLARMKKDYDAMSTYLNLGLQKEQPSIESASEVPMEIESSEKNDAKRKKKKKSHISPFLQLPEEVCRMIHGFICPLRQDV